MSYAMQHRSFYDIDTNTDENYAEDNRSYVR